ASAMPHKRGQEIELLWTKRDRRRASPDFTRGEIDDKICDARDILRSAARRCAFEKRAHPRKNLEQAGWLDDIIIRAEAETAQLFLFRAACGHDEHRRVVSRVAQPL